MRILFEDRHIVAVEKPVGVLSQGAADTDAPDLVSLLLQREKKNGTAEPYIGVVHRLDCGVGGAMVYAKKSYAAALLSDAAAKRENFRKEYLCIVEGMPAERTGELTDLLWKDARQNKVFVVSGMRRGVREANLFYEVLDTVSDADGTLSLLKITLGTGRSHQIRVQLSSRGTPLYGDGKYGARRKYHIGGTPAIALWSYHLAFRHPASLGREKDGRTPNPKAPRFPDPDLYSFPDTEHTPWSLFSEKIAELSVHGKKISE